MEKWKLSWTVFVRVVPENSGANERSKPKWLVCRDQFSYRALPFHSDYLVLANSAYERRHDVGLCSLTKHGQRHNSHGGFYYRCLLGWMIVCRRSKGVKPCCLAK